MPELTFGGVLFSHYGRLERGERRTSITILELPKNSNGHGLALGKLGEQQRTVHHSVSFLKGLLKNQTEQTTVSFRSWQWRVRSIRVSLVLATFRHLPAVSEMSVKAYVWVTGVFHLEKDKWLWAWGWVPTCEHLEPALRVEQGPVPCLGLKEHFEKKKYFPNNECIWAGHVKRDELLFRERLIFFLEAFSNFGGRARFRRGCECTLLVEHCLNAPGLVLNPNPTKGTEKKQNPSSGENKGSFVSWEHLPRSLTVRLKGGCKHCSDVCLWGSWKMCQVKDGEIARCFADITWPKFGKSTY